jgi:hypothetical protein
LCNKASLLSTSAKRVSCARAKWLIAYAHGLRQLKKV